jgi:hypothetical protein
VAGAPAWAAPTGGGALPWSVLAPATIVPPVLTDFTATAAPAGSSATQNTNYVYVTWNVAVGNSWATWLKAAPATPWTAIIGLVYMSKFGTFPTAGISLSDSTGKYVNWAVQWNGAGNSVPTLSYWNSSTSFSSAPLSVSWMLQVPVFWMYVTDNGTNILVGMLVNGIDKFQFTSVSRTAFLASGPTKVGFGLNNGTASAPVLESIVHWSGA